MSRRKRREFTEEFKLQMVQLFNSGKSRNHLIKEYDLTPSSLAKWINQYNSNQPFVASDNLSVLEVENIKLIKILNKKSLKLIFWAI